MKLLKKVVFTDVILLLAVVISYSNFYKNEAKETQGYVSSEEAKKIALTFDDGPTRENTAALLDGLKERNVQCTFFVIGNLAAENKDLLERMHNEGNLIGNHTYDHVQINKLSTDEAFYQISETNSLISSVTGANVDYVRAPYGEWDKKLDKKLDMIQVSWDVDPEDWNCDDKCKIVDKVVTTVKENDIILLHDTSMSSVTAAFEIIDILKETGYEFVTVDKLIFE